MFDDTTSQGNLEGEEKGEEELVALIQSPCGVLKHFKGKTFNDVQYTFASNQGLLRPKVG